MATAAFTFDQAAHVYRDDTGMIVPSVTQCLKAVGLISFNGISPAILERKRQLGTLVHKVAELYDYGEDLGEYDIPEQVLEYVEGYIMFRKDCSFTPSAIESRQIGEVYGMKFGMQPDRVGEINGIAHILELKCGAQQHPAWGWQLAGYGTGLYGPRPTLSRAALQLGPQFPRGYKIHPYDDPIDYRVWDSALFLTISQINNKLFTLEDVPERLEAV